MSYKFAQLRRSQLNNNDFLSPMSYELNDIITKPAISSDNISFVDKVINLLGNSKLDSIDEKGINKSYYLRVKIKQQQEEQKITIKLIKSDKIGEENEQKIETITVNSGNDYSSFDFIITPNSLYNKIKFELNRTQKDYITLNTTYTEESLDSDSFLLLSIYGRTMDITIETFGEIKNLITNKINPAIGYTGILKQIGVQGKPGLLMCINGEAIRVGRSGLYEINNGMDITFINFIIEEGDNQHFLLDYQY